MYIFLLYEKDNNKIVNIPERILAMIHSVTVNRLHPIKIQLSKFYDQIISGKQLKHRNIINYLKGIYYKKQQ